MTPEPWHLNKSVPLTLVFAIVMQTVALVWFISSLNSAVESNKFAIVKLESKTETLEDRVQSQAVTIARIDENLKFIRNSVETLLEEKGEF